MLRHYGCNRFLIESSQREACCEGHVQIPGARCEEADSANHEVGEAGFHFVAFITKDPFLESKEAGLPLRQFRVDMNSAHVAFVMITTNATAMEWFTASTTTIS